VRNSFARCYSAGACEDNMFEIQSGVPVPKSARTGRRSTASFPFAQMEIGDHFVIPFDPTGDEGKKLIDSWRRKILGAKKKMPEGYETRTAVLSNGLGVWRTA
jgi:hypothetical protein